jgi:hypothetical protein
MAVSAITACKTDARSEEGVKPLREQPRSGAEPRAGLPSMASGVDALVSVGHFQRSPLGVLYLGFGAVAPFSFRIRCRPRFVSLATNGF